MDYMDLDVRCSQKAVKLNHSLTHSLLYFQCHWSVHIIGPIVHESNWVNGFVPIGQITFFWTNQFTDAI